MWIVEDPETEWYPDVKCSPFASWRSKYSITNLILGPSSFVDFLLSSIRPLWCFFVGRSTITPNLMKKNRMSEAISFMTIIVSIKSGAIAKPQWSGVSLFAIVLRKKYSKYHGGVFRYSTHRATDSAALRRSNIVEPGALRHSPSRKCQFQLGREHRYERRLWRY